MEGKDLTKGNLLKNMVLLLIPLILTNLLNSIYSIVDGIFVGNLIGEEGVSAITNIFPLTLIIQSISEGLAVAASVLIAQYFGAKQEKKIKEVMGNIYMITFIVAVISTLLMVLTANFWLNLLDTPI